MAVKHVPGQGEPAENALNRAVAAHALVLAQETRLNRLMVRHVKLKWHGRWGIGWVKLWCNTSTTVRQWIHGTGRRMHVEDWKDTILAIHELMIGMTKKRKRMNKTRIAETSLHQEFTTMTVHSIAMHCFATFESHRQCHSNLHIHRQASSIANILVMMMKGSFVQDLDV